MGIPIPEFYGIRDDENVLVMQLLGKSVNYKSKFNNLDKQFLIIRVCRLAVEMVKIINYKIFLRKFFNFLLNIK